MARDKKDRETPWKELIELETARVLAFFWKDIHDEIDWPRGVESLEQDFRPLAPLPAGKGRLLVDKLLGVYARGTGELRYLHVEIQSYRERNFRWRVHTYNLRAEQRFGQPVVSMPLLIDLHPAWHPRGYRAEVFGTRRLLTFRTVKVLEWAKRADDLETDPNPVGLFVRAYLEGRRLEGDHDEAAKVKLRLMRRLKGHGLTLEELGRWFGLFDWLIQLPPEYNVRLLREVHAEDKEGLMPLISFIEQMGIDKGERIGLLKAVALGLELKFGPDGVALMPQVEKVEGLPALRAIYEAIRPTASLDDVRKLIPAAKTPQ